MRRMEKKEQKWKLLVINGRNIDEFPTPYKQTFLMISNTVCVLSNIKSIEHENFDAWHSNDWSSYQKLFINLAIFRSIYFLRLPLNSLVWKRLEPQIRRLSCQHINQRHSLYLPVNLHTNRRLVRCHLPTNVKWNVLSQLFTSVKILNYIIIRW